MTEEARYVVIAEFIPRPGRAQAFIELILRQASASLREEPGCLVFDVCVDDGTPRTVLLYEAYQDAAAYVAHRANPRHPVFLREARRLVELFDGQIFRSRRVLCRIFTSGGRLR
ncbi:putative quinol monooxygenase [Candidimonas nitroreducens]|uniref:Antibiotic biosynthesis monooxygenase n=1 Tax=Candidimonas nitroreducens TaxID=683354 RepID=A0A225MB69_9BURK|nr:putative quinol monooxygenase [Candidimonas nitroreducens]OWT57390.1 antibiotic biosynthesis monooxygenase [Candidimonas nitroreducens]